jgi:hypothetical protein
MTGAPIFITARFRSGSTLLWNIFAGAGGFRSYYEPCHDNLLAHIRCTRPVESHRGVESYWDSYRGLESGLEAHHRPAFGLTRLVMEAHEEWPALEAYLRHLIGAAAPARPALQFNRVDFRLPWLKARFPEATIVHLWRDVRESFASLVRHIRDEPWDRPDRANVYDVFEWCVALAPILPFLADPAIESLYQRHYYLWKLSRLMGERNAHVSLSFDRDFQDDPGRGLQALAAAGCLPEGGARAARSLIRSIERGSWAALHPEERFAQMEQGCESVLEELGLNEWFGARPLAEIRARRPGAWARWDAIDRSAIVDQMLLAYSEQRGEVTRLLSELRTRAGS